MTQNKQTQWHYPRTALAEKILTGFRGGYADRFTIFAPRRRGKTEFIQYDITPLAREQGILVVYVDFWRNKSSPALSFATAVASAKRSQETWFSNIIGNSSLKASLKLFGGDVSLDVSQLKAAEKDVIEAAFAELDSTRVPILLLLDEVQHLATDPAFSDFTAALRSFMTARTDGKIKAIFTGSSQEGLAQLFKRTKAPFFNSSAAMDFPDLGEDFVAFELEVFHRVTGGTTLDKIAANELFKAMNYAPGQFTDLLKRMVLEGVHSIREGAARFSDAVIEDENRQFREMWDRMHAMDRAILIMLSRGWQKGMYSEELRDKIQTICPECDANKKSNIQNAISRLKSAPISAIYSAEHGKWQFADPAFEQFVSQQDTQD